MYIQKLKTRFKMNPDIPKDQLHIVMWENSNQDWICTDFVWVADKDSSEIRYVMQPLVMADGLRDRFTGMSAFVLSEEEMAHYFIEAQETEAS